MQIRCGRCVYTLCACYAVTSKGIVPLYGALHWWWCTVCTRAHTVCVQQPRAHTSVRVPAIGVCVDDVAARAARSFLRSPHVVLLYPRLGVSPQQPARLVVGERIGALSLRLGLNKMGGEHRCCR